MERGLWRQVLADVRWSFTPPWTWLSGVAANLVLSLLWLVAVPLRGRPHSDWAILVGNYFVVFILADVTTTNVLGADAARLRLSLMRNVSLWRILLIKNLTLLLIVGLPTLIATAIITLNSEAEFRLVLTLPGVAFPILTWLGVGNIVSVSLPVAAIPLRERWQQRRQFRATARWLVAMALPYALWIGVSPVGQLPNIVRRQLPSLPKTAEAHGAVLLITGFALYAVGTAIALAIARRRKINFDDYR